VEGNGLLIIDSRYLRAMTSILSIQGINKFYGSYQALNEVNLEVKKGSVFGLLGPNGAGKTSLIRIINQITAPDSGAVRFNGEKLHPDHISKIGYLPEERGLYKKMKVGEQCVYLAQLKGLSKEEATRRLNYWFDRFNATDWWSKTIEDLSKGMAQKVQFISTILHEPELLILDEPFSGFDPINAALIRDEMLRLKSMGATIILSTHDMGSVEELCDDIALINKSKVIVNGSVNEVKSQYKQGLFEIAYKGTAMELGIVLGPQFELIHHIVGEESNLAQIKIGSHQRLNDLLLCLMSKLEIISAQEVIPNMNDIFISAVTQAQQN
jgi:ABC-2 type transport system ATP-binding protein